MESENRRVRALVVDDNYDAAASFSMLLTTMGCEASFLVDPREAVSEALRFNPDIAFLDVRMPHLSGYQLAELLRVRFASEKLKLVALSGYGREEDIAASRKAGFDTHMLKPPEIGVVQGLLKSVGRGDR